LLSALKRGVGRDSTSADAESDIPSSPATPTRTGIWGRWYVWPTVIIVIAVTHFFIAPATVRLREHIQESIHRWRGANQAEIYIAGIQGAPGKCREDLIPCALAFRDFLATRNIRLHILLRPGIEDLITPSNALQAAPTEGSRALYAAENALGKAGIHTVNLLPDMYREASLHPGRPVMHPDLGHLSDDMVLVMARTFCNTLDDAQKKSDGSNMLLVGDCYAFLSATRIKQRKILQGIRSKWKNSSDSHMAYEFSRLPPEQVPGVRDLYWFLSSACVKPYSVVSLPFPSAPEPSEITSANTRVVAAQVTRLSHIPSPLGTNSPYANAMALHECVTHDGEKFLAIVPVMENRKVLPAQGWALGQKVLLSMQRWDAATRATPGLGREQIFDDLEDLTLYQYYITAWSTPP
jgi:hypothetical protein